MKKLSSRWAAGLSASALMLGGMTFATGGVANAAPGNPGESCENPAVVSVFEFNDFHGRIQDAAALFTPVEAVRAQKGDENVLLLSTGDNIGGSTFESFIDRDFPTIDIMKAIKVDAIATGNHEFDKGFADLSERVIPGMEVPHISANVYTKGTTTVAAPLQEYIIFEKAGVRIAYVGAVTGDLPSLVSPSGISGITAGDPVEAVNRVAQKIVDEDLADILIAGFHEGAPEPSKTAAQNADISPAFADIYRGLDDNFDVVLNGHTHKLYNWETENGKPLMQAGQYAENLSRVDLNINSSTKELCGTEATSVKIDKKAPVGDTARIQKIEEIYAAAKVTADKKGAVDVGKTGEAISTAGKGDSGTRNVESPMTNTVAQMFKEKLQTEANAATFIGVQNPGGTRASLNKGDVTLKEAAGVLSFANSLETTELTGAQVKLMLEQQWQLNVDGEVPSRPYLALGLSDNVTYTFDESRERLDRITSISIDGLPIDMAGTYTLGSGNFLISGGDNFFAFKEGKNTQDSGRVDLETWVEWVGEQGVLLPDYSKRGVSTKAGAEALTEGGASVDYVFGMPLKDGVQMDTLDMLLDQSGDVVSPELKNTTIKAFIGEEEVGTGTVTDGVATIKVSIKDGTAVVAGANIITFKVADSGTTISLPVTVTLKDKPTPTPTPKPGLPSTGV